METKIAVIGLGYVGLPLALALAEKFEGTVGFDVDANKVQALKGGRDPNGEGLDQTLKNTPLHITSDAKELKSCNFFIVGVPTPVDENNNPDLTALRAACKTVGSVMPKGSIVVFESTVYPGVTEDICGPTLEQASNLKCGIDFKLGYSPERMNPGDKEHTLSTIVKVVSAEDSEALEQVARVYSTVVPAGIHRASSIKVAEAAKVIENTQRDLNIALMNELAIIFDRLGISTKEVIDAASTKWNFLRFLPGLVGGHCIGVDPYYLTSMAQQLGYHPQVILAGRRINDSMGSFIAQRLVKLMVNAGMQIRGARVGILGLTFKENVMDIRNSRVPDIVHELNEFGIATSIHDPHADAHMVKEEYGLLIEGFDALQNLEGLVLAVPHRHFTSLPLDRFTSKLKTGGIFIDVKSVFDPKLFPKNLTYWSL